jgi:hypothetical protein
MYLKVLIIPISAVKLDGVILHNPDLSPEHCAEQRDLFLLKKELARLDIRKIKR